MADLMDLVEQYESTIAEYEQIKEEFSLAERDLHATGKTILELQAVSRRFERVKYKLDEAADNKSQAWERLKEAIEEVSQ